MICKLFEVRDEATHMSMLAVKLEPGCERDRLILERAGFTEEPERQARYVLLVDIADNRCRATYDPYNQTGRTTHNAHLYIERHFDTLESGAVVDVRFILGETPEPCESELQS